MNEIRTIIPHDAVGVSGITYADGVEVEKYTAVVRWHFGMEQASPATNSFIDLKVRVESVTLITDYVDDGKPLAKSQTHLVQSMVDFSDPDEIVVNTVALSEWSQPTSDRNVSILQVKPYSITINCKTRKVYVDF